MKLVTGPSSSHVGSIDVLRVGTGLVSQLGGRGRMQLDPMLLSPPSQSMPPIRMHDRLIAFIIRNRLECNNTS